MKRSFSGSESTVPQTKKRRRISHVTIPNLPDPDPDVTEADYILEQYPIAWRDILRENWSNLCTRYRRPGRITTNYVFQVPTEGVDETELKNYLRTIYYHNENAFKCQISISTLLFNMETEEYRIFLGTNNFLTLWERPQLVAGSTDLEQLLEGIDIDDHLELASTAREETKWRVMAILSYQVTTYSLGNVVPLFGCVRVSLPSWILHCKNIWTLTAFDRKCFFAALAAHQLDKPRGLSRGIKHLEEQWALFNNLQVIGDGRVSMEDLDQLEKCFQIRINIYQCSSDKRLLQCRISNRMEYNQNLNLLREGQHFCLIRNMEKFAKVFRCFGCNYITHRANDATKHSKIRSNCTTGPKIIRIGGNFLHAKKTLFELLKLEGIPVDEEHKFVPYFCVFDLESVQNVEHHRITIHKSHETTLSLVCAAIHSNVPGFNPVFYRLETDEADLVSRIIRRWLEIAEAAETLMRQRVAHLFHLINERIITIDAQRAVADSDDQDLTNFFNWEEKRWKKYQKQLERHCTKFSVYAYNANFDWKLMRRSLTSSAKDMGLKCENMKMINVHGKLLMVELNNKIQIKDAYALVGGGTLRQFLKSFASEDVGKKMRFPHAWLTSVEKLNQNNLPPRTEWKDDLSGKEVSVEKYEKCCKTFDDKECKSMWDWMELYNLSDTIPLVRAVENLAKFWRSHGICQNSMGFTLPGLSLKLLVNRVKDENGLIFWQPTSLPRDLFVADAIDNHILGGLSMVFQRRAEVGHCFDGTDFEVQSIIGRDYTMLYSHQLASDQLTSVPALWSREENGVLYRRKRLMPAGTSFGELEFCLYVQWWCDREYGKGRYTVEHTFNGQQLRVGGRKYRLDAAVRKERLGFCYFGCYFHCHPSCKNGHYAKDLEKAEQKANELRELGKYFAKIGWNLIICYECQFQNYRCNPAFRAQVAAKHLMLSRSGPATKAQLLQRIKNGSFYGILTGCHVRVPREKWEYFDGFPPVFRHEVLNESHLGSLMRKWHLKSNIKFSKRKTLLSGFEGKDLSLTTDLVRFYLQQNIELDFDKAIEFKRHAPFKEFVDMVAKKREEADADKSKKVFANLLKLICNSCYGRTLIDSSKWLRIALVYGEKRGQKLVASPHFKYLEEYGNDFYEVGQTKTRYVQTGCRSIGFNVLQGSKLSMLKYYYEYLMPCLGANFKSLLCDTDSLYYALRTRTFEESVLPGQLSRYHHLRDKFETTEETKYIPGKLKLEWQGKALIALSPKCNFGLKCNDDESNKDKYTLKGIRKNLNPLTYNHFDEILKSQTMLMAENRGLEMSEGQWHQYRQRKVALSFGYYKRDLLPPLGENTRCLDYVIEEKSHGEDEGTHT